MNMQLLSVNLAITAGTAQTILTPATGKKFRLRGYSLALSVAGGVLFEEGAGDAAVLRVPSGGIAAIATAESLGPGVLSTTANNVLKIDATATGQVTGWVLVSEE